MVTFHPYRKYIPLFLGCAIGVVILLFVVFGLILDTDFTYYYTTLIKIAVICYIMLCWSLYLASRKNPGFVPKLKKSDNLQSFDQVPSESFCQICFIEKPERAHHCSKCNQCVLNMDHHCLITATCVGLFNRKAFILVLFYGSVALFCALLFSITRIGPMFGQIVDNVLEFNFYDLLRTFITEILYVGSSLNFFGLFYFFIYHIKLIVLNQSTLDEIDDPEKKNDKKYIQKMKFRRTAYNMGWFKNLQFYFGKNILLWFIPIGKPLGDGYNWDKKQEFINLEEQQNQNLNNNLEIL